MIYVTAYLDLFRENWSHWKRDNNTYFEAFSRLVELMKREPDDELFVFIDKIHSKKVKEIVGDANANITIIEIDRDWLTANSVLWRRIAKEREILGSEKLKELLGPRYGKGFPETLYPEYTLINHCKIDFIAYAINLSNSFWGNPDDFYAWVDFGYFQKEETVPVRGIDITKIPNDRIFYSLINSLDERDFDIVHTLQTAPEKIGGFFFCGMGEKMLEYQKVYHFVHESLQNIGVVDDDQHVVLQCIKVAPKLFALGNCGGWHMAMRALQKGES